MDFDKLHFITAEQIQFLERRAEFAVDNLTPIEQSDSLEAVGTAKFFNGDYQAAIYFLESSVGSSYRSIKSDRRLAYVFSLLGLLYYRLGDLVRSEGNLYQAIDASERCGEKNLHTIALSNLAVAKMRSGDSKEAIKAAKDALELASHLFPTNSSQYIQHVRVLISIYIRNGDFAKAEHLAEENQLPHREKSLLRAGIKFAHGNYRSAGSVLLESISFESRSTTAGAPSSSPLATTPRATTTAVATTAAANRVQSSDSSGGIAFNDDEDDDKDDHNNTNTTATAATAGKINSSSGDIGTRNDQIGHKYQQRGHSSREKDDLEEFHQDIMQAMVTFNLEVLRVAVPPSAGRFADSKTAMEDFLKKLHTRRQRQSIEYPPEHVNHEPDPYLQLPFNSHPDYLSFDTYLYPVVVLCTMLAASAEHSLLTAHYSSGLSIESGRMQQALDVKGLDAAIDRIKEEFRKAVQTIESSFPRAVIAATPVLMVPFRRSSIMSIAGTASVKSSTFLPPIAASVSSAAGEQPSAVLSAASIDEGFTVPTAAAAGTAGFINNESNNNPFDSSFVVRAQAGTQGMFAFGAYSVAYSNNAATATAAGIAAAAATGEGSKLLIASPAECDLPDVSVVKDHAIGYGLLAEMKKIEAIPVEPIASGALIKLRDEYGVEVEAATGRLKQQQKQQQLVLPDVENAEQLKAKSGSRKESSKQTTTAAAKAATGRSSASAGGRKKKQQPQEKSAAVADSTTDAAATAAVENSAATEKSEQYNANYNYVYAAAKHDLGTVHSEIMPLLDHFGRDDTSAWIEWAISCCGGASMGILAQQCPNPREKIGLDWELMQQQQKQPSKLLLQEVRNRLLEVETKLTATPRGAKIHLDHKHVNIESRVIISLLLTKISAQLREHKETGHYLIQLEHACEELNSFQSRSMDSIYYSAITIRMRLDFEEWSVPQLVSDGWMITHLVHKMLPLAKRYLLYCEELRDVLLQRDALKKLLNIYLEVGNIPLSDDVDEKSQTLSQLVDISRSEIEEQEVNNPEWLQRNGRLRAVECMQQMKQLAATQFAD